MDLPPPRFVAVQGVLGLPALLPLSPEIDEVFIAAARSEFPNVVMRQPPLTTNAGNTPRLVLASTSSQLVISASQADFEVRFYGDYPANADACLDYTHRKIEAVRQAFSAIGYIPANIGVVARLQFSFKELDESPVPHILAHHLSVDTDVNLVEDAVARVALKVRDKYFVTLRIINYEARVVQRPVMPGDLQPMIIKPWEGSIEDYGIELTVDINNMLENRIGQQDAHVTENGVDSVIALLKQVALTVGPQFVDTAEVNLTALVPETA